MLRHPYSYQGRFEFLLLRRLNRDANKTVSRRLDAFGA